MGCGSSTDTEAQNNRPETPPSSDSVSMRVHCFHSMNGANLSRVPRDEPDPKI